MDTREKLIRYAHLTQKDKVGYDYVEHHLLPVAASVPEHLYHAALAHDVLEDTDIPMSALIESGFTGHDRYLITLLTKRRDEPYETYIQRISLEPDAVIIKIADIVNNLSRIERVGPEGQSIRHEDKVRLRKKYQRALSILAGVD